MWLEYQVKGVYYHWIIDKWHICVSILMFVKYLLGKSATLIYSGIHDTHIPPSVKTLIIIFSRGCSYPWDPQVCCQHPIHQLLTSICHTMLSFFPFVFYEKICHPKYIFKSFSPHTGMSYYLAICSIQSLHK